MLLTVEKIWSKVQEFVKRVGDLEDNGKETDKEVSHLKKELDLLAKGLNHSEKIQNHQGAAIAALEARIKKLESDKKGLAISAGKAKAKVARLENQAKH